VNHKIGEGEMSEESSRARLRKKGFTDKDLTTEGFLKWAEERGDQEAIKKAKDHLAMDARLKRIQEAVRNGIDPKTVE
jgi:hypothetical protein